jgi:hypothetical protein
MQKEYWLQRQQESFDMACNATNEAARLIHLELADRYRIEAANGNEPVSPGAKDSPAYSQGKQR